MIVPGTLLGRLQTPEAAMIIARPWKPGITVFNASEHQLDNAVIDTDAKDYVERKGKSQ